MEDIAKYLTGVVVKALADLGITPENPGRVIYLGERGVDYTFRSVISLCRMHNTDSPVKLREQDLAEMIVGQMDLDASWQVTIARGNINFTMTPSHIGTRIDQFLSADSFNYNCGITPGKKILVDFSSPNIAKPMHVGHLRSTIIGDSICRLFERQSAEVLRINHIGDFGLPLGMIIQLVIDDGLELSGGIDGLQKIYAESKRRFDTNDDFKMHSYARVVELQNNHPETTAIWQRIKSISMVGCQQIYNRMSISLVEMGESFYQGMIPAVVQELADKGLLSDDDGRKVIWVPGYKEPLTIIKADGGLTYDTTDLAAIRYRLVDLSVDHCYYVVAIEQSLHFELIFAVAKLAGWMGGAHVEHIKFGLVSDDTGKRIRSRSGDTIKLSDLLDEAVRRVTETTAERTDGRIPPERLDDVIQTIAYGAIKYADLSSRRMINYKFSYDKMLALSGNTAPYLLYAHMRAASILRRANYDGRILPVMVEDPHEAELCKVILRFPEIIEKLNGDLMFHALCGYLYKLAECFTHFITHCQCVQCNEENIITINWSRIMICEATRRVFRECFDILGMGVVDYM